MAQQATDGLLRKQATLDLLDSHLRDARLSENELDKELAKRFRKFLNLAAKAPWWGKQIAGIETDLRKTASIKEILELFPVLTRTEIQQHGEELRVPYPGAEPNDIGMLLTSGSTGKPVRIFRHIKTHQVQHAATELLDVVWQKRDLTKNSAYLKIAPENDVQPTMGEPYSYLGPTGKVYRRSLGSNTIPQLLDFLVEENIKNFLLNPMVLKFLIKEQKRSPRKAKFEQIMTWADRLEPELRIEAKELFGAKICDRYSSTEFGFLAMQCSDSEHLHALQFNNYIEILDDEGKRCPIGVPGRVVVTSLQNLAMPLIRYELGDIAAFGPPCEFGIGLPVFEPRIGRKREALLTEEGGLEIPYFDDTELARSLEVVDYQGFRFQDALVLVYESTAEVSQAALEATKEKLLKVFKTVNRVELVRLPSLGFLGLWKRRLVIEVAEDIPVTMDQQYFERVSKK